MNVHKGEGCAFWTCLPNGYIVCNPLNIMNYFRRHWIPVCFLLLAILIYGPLFGAPYLAYDDDYNIFANPYFIQGDWYKLWIKPYFGMYFPLTSSVWALLYQVGGGQVWPFRVLNFALHMANTFLVYLILNFIFQKVKIFRQWLLAFAVAVFAFHPLQVESVAWITGARDLLACFWCLLAVIFFYQANTDNYKKLSLAALFFLFSLLSKASFVTMPVAIVFIYRLLKMNLSLAQKKSLGVWLIFSISIVGITYFTQQEAIHFTVFWWERPLVMFDNFGFYLKKFFFPVELTVDYGRTPNYVQSNFLHWLPNISIFYLVTGLLFLRKNFWILIWCLLMLPVSGLVVFAYQRISSVADHYCYMSIAMLILATSVFVDQIASRYLRIPWKAILFATTLVLAIASSNQVQFWRNDDTLFRKMLDYNPDSYAAGVGLSSRLCESPLHAPEGLVTIERVLQNKPLDLLALANKAFCLYSMDRYLEVIQIEKELVTPELREQVDGHVVGSASLFATLGASFVRGGRLERGLAYVCQAEALHPSKGLYGQNRVILQQFMQEKGRYQDCKPGATAKDFLDSVVKSNL